MKKITQPAKIWALITGFLFFTIIFSTASTSEIADLEITDIVVEDVLCPENPSGSIEITVTGGTDTNSYEWIKEDGTTYTTIVPKLSGLLPGTYTVTVTDLLGSSSSVTSDPINLVATDNVAPVISVTEITQSADSGECSANLSIDPDAVSITEDCSYSISGTRSDDLPLTDPYPVGPTTIAWTATDSNGNTSTVDQTIVVTDDELPVITTQDINLECEQAIDFSSAPYAPVVTDNCTAAQPVGSRDDGKNLTDPFPYGTTTITWNVKDVNGNDAAPVEQIITVTDGEAPIVITKNITVQLDASGAASITPAEINNGTSDNCYFTLALDKDTFDCSDIGIKPIVTLTATDGNRNMASATAEVTVQDTLAPVITAENIEVSTDTGECFATVPMTASAEDNCSSTSLNGIRSDGLGLSETFPVGETQITWTATDAQGNETDPVVQTITVVDDEIPIIQQLADIEENNTPGTCQNIITVQPPDVNENCGIQAVFPIRDDGKDINSPYPVGTTTITWNAQDTNGNWAETIDQKIIIYDVEPPATPTLPDLKSSCEITLIPPTTTDNCTPTDEIKVTTNDPLTYKPQNNISEHVITWRFEDAAGNVSTAEQNLTINPLISSSTVSTITCNGGNDGSITITGEGGYPPYSYALNNGNFGDINSFDGLSEGTYTVKVKDLSGCIISEEIEILQPAPLQYTPPANNINTTSTAESCFGALDGTITVNGTISGGSGIYQYSIDNNNFGSNPITGLSAGEYTVFIQDNKGCTLPFILNATVEGPDELEASITPRNPTCYNSDSGFIEVFDPKGGNDTNYSFRINNGPWQSNSTPTGYKFTQLPEGRYTVEMKDFEGCVKTLGTYTLTDPAELLPNVTATRTTTYGSATGTATVNPTGGNGTYNYLWKDINGAKVGDTKFISGLKAGTYTVTVTDSKGCIGTEQFVLYDKITTEIDAISLCLETDDTIRTSTFQVDIEKTMGGEGEAYRFQYEWNFGEGASLPEGTTGIGPHVVSYSSTGDKEITLTVTDEAGQQLVYTSNHYVGECFEACSSANNFSGDKNSFYLGDINGTKMVTSQCDLSEPMYLWFIVGEKSANGYMLNTEFIYTVTNRNSTKQFRATNCYSNPDYNQDGDPDILVPGQKVRLNQVGTGENQLHWQCDEVLNIIHITYRWTVNPGKACGDTNNNHCASTNETMSVAAPIRGFAETTGTCFNQREGSITIDAYGGTNDFTYLAVNNDSGEEFESSINVINDLPAGTYTLTITDNKEVADGQQKNYYVIENLVVSESDSGLTASIKASDVSCYGNNDGMAEVFDVEGGTPFMANGESYYKYLWNDSRAQTTSKADNLAPGNYTVTITDAFGCTLTKEVPVDEPPALTIANAGPDQTKCGFTSTTLEANTAVSGNGKWSISSSSVGANGTIADVYDPNSRFTGTKGAYTLEWTISSADGSCQTTDSVVITIIEECNYLDFDGLDDYIDFGTDPYNFDTGNYSLEAWVKLKTTSGTRTILSKRDANNLAQGGYELVVTSGGLPGFKIGEGIIFPDKSIPLNTQRWYHLAITYNGTNIKMFVDGLEVNNVTTINNSPITNPNATSAPFIIGATYDTSSNRITKPSSHFNGWIEEVRLWNKALTPHQIRFMMNQRLENNAGIIKGKELPLNVPGPLSWTDLAGYYQLLAQEAAIGDGTTKDLSSTPVHGVLKNITTFQENTAPLPYVSKRDGNWRDIETSTTPWLYGRGRWDAPNSLGINQQPINWNIVRSSHNIESGNSNIKVLGLLSIANEISVFDPNFVRDEYNPGHSLTVSHYLKLNGSIDLEGESQLLQDEGSILEETSTGYIERDQQGTASSYNYNYWSSPVSPIGTPNNAPYSVKSILKDGSNPEKPGLISFNYQYHYADWSYPEPLRISSYWLFKYTNFQSNTYSEWLHIGESGSILPGEGYTMKGTSGSAAITDRQNYTFKGKPHNGTIRLVINPGNDYLIGNPYPSAIDSRKFILDNIKDLGGHNTQNVFNGTLYFWDHFAGKTHYLKKYIGGYAMLNLSGGIQAIANDERINATGQRADASLNPKRYIPVGQAFYVSTQLNESIAGLTTVEGGEITFRNSQRVFETEHQIDDESIFKSRKEKEEAQKQADEDKRAKVYLRYISPEGFQRQILVTRDSISSTGFDLGYDAPLIEDIDEDMYWTIHDVGFVIQAVPDFGAERELPLIVKVHQEGEFSIKIDKLENIPADLQIHLKDSLSETTYDLRKSEFTTSEPEGMIKGRFSLVFPLPAVEKETAESGNAESINSYYSSKETKVTVENPFLIPIKSAILYNLNGQKLSEYGEIPTQKVYEIPIGERASGVYILKLQMEEESKSVKFVVE